MHGTRLQSASNMPDSTAVVIEAAQANDLAPLMLQACELTPREREIAQMLLRGLPIAEMAAMLWLSPYTIRDHIKSVYNKVGVRSRPELCAKLFYEHYAAPPNRA